MIAYARLRRASTIDEVRTWQTLPMDALSGAGMLLLILTGLAMAGQEWSFTDGWILTAILLLVVAIAAGGAGTAPRMGRLRKALEAAGPAETAASPELTTLTRDPVLHGVLRFQLVAVLEFVYLMVRKPSGLEIFISLLVMLVAVAAVCWPLFAGGRPAPAGGGASPAA